MPQLRAGVAFGRHVGRAFAALGGHVAAVFDQVGDEHRRPGEKRRRSPTPPCGRGSGAAAASRRRSAERCRRPAQSQAPARHWRASSRTQRRRTANLFMILAECANGGMTHAHDDRDGNKGSWPAPSSRSVGCSRPASSTVFSSSTLPSASTCRRSTVRDVPCSATVRLEPHRLFLSPIDMERFGATHGFGDREVDPLFGRHVPRCDMVGIPHDEQPRQMRRLRNAGFTFGDLLLESAHEATDGIGRRSDRRRPLPR